jgi:1-acyl-sn-glycerol-3-phosphate acyltransferase
LTSAILRIDDSQIARVPDRGPLLIVTNHVNIIEIPVIYTRLQPRPATGFVDARRWQTAWSRWLLKVAGAIPLHRGEADIAAFRTGIRMLAEGHILIISPEGTRSGHGRLGYTHPGIVLLGVRSGAPILPIIYQGAEDYLTNLCRLQRTDFRLIVGQPFHLDTRGEGLNRQVRRRMMDEIGYQMAALLPPLYRGVYADLEQASQRYLRFLPQ